VQKINMEHTRTHVFTVPDKIWMETWKQTGSAERAAKYLKKSKFAKKWGKKIDMGVVLKNAWMWAIYNPEEARKMLDGEREKVGQSHFEDKEFDLMLIRRSMSLFNTRLRQFSHWIEMYNYQEYAYVYERRFPRIARKHRAQLEEIDSQEVSV
jgi:hypothetical protein